MACTVPSIHDAFGVVLTPPWIVVCEGVRTDIILLSDPLPMHDFHEQPPVWHGPRYVCPVGLGHPNCILVRNVWVWILVFSAVQLKPNEQNSITRYDSEAYLLVQYPRGNRKWSTFDFGN